MREEQVKVAYDLVQKLETFQSLLVEAVFRVEALFMLA